MNAKRISSLILLFFMLAAANAQTRISSPYTRYGIGDLLNNKYIRNTAMGGLSFGFRDSTTVNYSNPASYTSLHTGSFIFETGVNSLFNQIESTTQKQISNYTSLSHLVFAFPVTRWWGASIGLLPYSSVGYNILSKEYVDNVGLLHYYYQGAGGFNQFYFGNAFRIKNFSFGVNSSYLFGSLDKMCNVILPDSATFLRTKVRYSTRTSDFLFNYGVQYQKKINSKLKIVGGVTFNTKTDLSSMQDSVVYRYSLGTDSSETIKDTIIYSIDNKGAITLPSGIGAGITFGVGEKWLFGVDYQMQNWKDYKCFGESDDLANSTQISYGMEYTPNVLAVTKRWKRASFRLGARYNQSYLQLHNTQLKEYAVSFGVGIPVKSYLLTKPMMNIGFELGQRGTTENSLIKESFCRVMFSLTVHEKWFLKRRFD